LGESTRAKKQSDEEQVKFFHNFWSTVNSQQSTEAADCG
jgi:hypothetical protein